MTDSLSNMANRVNKKRRRRRAAVLVDADEVYGWSVRQVPGKPAVAKWELHRDPLVSLVAVPGVLAGIDRLVFTLVLELRANDLSWADIGQCLGISRQAAQKRYGVVDGVLDGTVDLGDDDDDPRAR